MGFEIQDSGVCFRAQGSGFRVWILGRRGERGALSAARRAPGTVLDFRILNCEAVPRRARLVLKARRLLYHSTLGSRVIKKRRDAQ